MLGPSRFKQTVCGSALWQYASGRKKDISMYSMHDFAELVYCICIECHACQKIGFGSEAVRGSPGGALDRQHGLHFARNRQMSLVSFGLQNEMKDSLLLHCTTRSVYSRCRKGGSVVVRSFVHPRDLSGY